MFVRFFTQLNQYPKLILLVILALSAFFFVQARDGLFDPVSGSLRINSTVEPFIERDSGAYQQFLDAREAFGSEEVVVIALHNTEKEPVGLDYLLTLSHLKADIETNVPGISKVLSMLDIPQASGKCAGKSYFHQMGIGSVCLSVLEKYEHQISCLNSSSAENQAPLRVMTIWKKVSKKVSKKVLRMNLKIVQNRIWRKVLKIVSTKT